MVLEDFPVTVGEPFRFEWWVDQNGYELVEPQPRPPGRRATLLDPASLSPQIKRRGGPMRAYRPFDDNPGLFLEFAHTENTPEGFIDFANQYGLMGRLLFDDPQKLEAEYFDDWQRAWTTLQHIVWCIERALKNSEPLSPLAEILDNMARPRMRARLASEFGRKPQLRMEPDTLFGAMWLQAANQITGGQRYKQCKACPRWFPYGPGTGSRSSKMFCSDRCRVAWNRKADAEGAVC